MADGKPVLLNFRGGRNGIDPLYALLPNQCAEAIDVDWNGSLLGRKRGGSSPLPLTGGTAVTGPINTLFRHLPGNDETKAEFWDIDSAATPVTHRLAGGTAWADVTVDDAITARIMDTNYVSFNGKLFLAYASAVDRLHVYDPNIPVNIGSQIVGGGGGGGGTGGGGGGGAVIVNVDAITTTVALPVVVGGGGPGGASFANGTAGVATTFNGHTAGGGGLGAGNNSGAPPAGGNGVNGSSGGGGAAGTIVASAGGTGSSPGHNGGANNTNSLFGGGGGGGAVAAGTAGSTTNGGAGGVGIVSVVPGDSNVYGSGGGGGIESGATGGVGGTNAGSGTADNTTAGAGTANFGGGGGGGGFASGNGATGGAGGSGRVQIWYKTGTLVATGGSITTSGAFTIHTFTGNGTWTVTSVVTAAVRRVGIATTAAPTAADAGSGSWAATIRYYRVRWAQGNFAAGLFAWPSIVTRVSEPSPVQSFIPSGSGASTKVIQPTPPGERETHWIIEASTNNVTFYMLGCEPVVTTTYSDATATITAQPGSDAIGTYALPGAAKFLITDGNRILMAGSSQPSGANSGGKNNRVWFTPVLGSLLRGDDERVPTTLASYTDLEENAGDTITGFGGPIFNGVIFPFMYRRVWRLTPTGDVTIPYLQRKVSDAIGLVHQKALDLAEDEIGQPAVYFIDPHKGAYRIGSSGFQYIGHDMEDQWKGLNGKSAVNLGAANIPATVLYYPDIHQVWHTIATGASDDPDTVMCFDTQLGQPQNNGEVRGGWSIHTPPKARCTALFANTVGATMSRDLKPYTALVATATVLKRDTADKDDNGTAFKGFVTSGVVLPGSSLGINVGVAESILVAKPLGSGAAPVTIQQTLIRDFGVETRTSTVTLTPAGSETLVMPKFEGSAMAQAGALQVTLGDVSAVASGQWSLEGLMIPLDKQGDR